MKSINNWLSVPLPGCGSPVSPSGARHEGRACWQTSGGWAFTHGARPGSVRRRGPWLSDPWLHGGPFLAPLRWGLPQWTRGSLTLPIMCVCGRGWVLFPLMCQSVLEIATCGNSLILLGDFSCLYEGLSETWKDVVGRNVCPDENVSRILLLKLCTHFELHHNEHHA